ncbi:MAG: YegS/Rv2252/BmrU family lipid kinase [Candidatus Eremiobacteraeota bacterium]|nr:YegS/Rv2252/BmrU family lipid kinase [Candidatus Eremiobacteraeota bacterium]
METTVIVNEHSSGARSHIAELRKLLAERDIRVTAFDIVTDHQALKRCAKRALNAGAESILLAGGDGSMTTIVDVLARSETVLGVLPLGTGNSFAKTLTIPETLAEAVDVIARGRVAQVDLGMVDDTHFANFSVIGLSAEVANAAPHALKPLLGPLTYVVGGIAPFLRHRAFRARLRFDGRRMEFPTHQIVIASGRYFGTKPITADASIGDGKLTVFTTSGLSHVDVATMYVALGLGLQEHLRDAISLRTSEIAIKAKPKQRVSIDGSHYGSTPVRYGVARRALRVFVPATFADAS